MMRKSYRLLAVLMWSVTVTLLALTMQSAQLQASNCCQACEQIDAACAGTCETECEGQSSECLSNCYQSCDDYSATCWGVQGSGRYCTWCSYYGSFTWLCTGEHYSPGVPHENETWFRIAAGFGCFIWE